MTVADDATSEADRTEEATRNRDLFRPTVLARYQDNPQLISTQDTSFNPERMRPRWVWVHIGLVFLAIMLVLGLTVQVPVGPSGMIAAADGRELTVAVPSYYPPEDGTEITLAVPSGNTVDVRVTSSEIGEPGLPVTMLFVQVSGSENLAELREGTNIVIQRDSTPLLRDIIENRRVN